MNGVLLSDNPTVILNLLDPGVILFGALFVLFGAAITLSLLLKQRPALSWPLLSLLTVILCCFAGILVLEFSAASDAFYTIGALEELSGMLRTHRWLLFQLPIILTAMSLIILATYREHIGRKHAFEYRGAIIVSILLSFGSLLIIGLESLI